MLMLDVHLLPVYHTVDQSYLVDVKQLHQEALDLQVLHLLELLLEPLGLFLLFLHLRHPHPRPHRSARTRNNPKPFRTTCACVTKEQNSRFCCWNFTAKLLLLSPLVLPALLPLLSYDDGTTKRDVCKRRHDYMLHAWVDERATYVGGLYATCVGGRTRGMQHLLEPSLVEYPKVPCLLALRLAALFSLEAEYGVVLRLLLGGLELLVLRSV